MSFTVDIHASRAYTVRIETGLLDRVGALLREKTAAETVCIVSGQQVWPLYGQRLEQSLHAAGFRTLRFVHPSGEQHKNLKTYGEILEFLAGEGLSRSDLLLSLGGGVTGDLTGFAAATYQRGLDYVQIPTTLLAMVDSSVGGKTAVDLPAGKNLAGCFWQPLSVLCDPALLETLEERELRCGAAEVIKYALIDGDGFPDLSDPAAVRRAPEAVIERSAAIKEQIVLEDAKDLGIRQILNLGHTIGHAVEKLSAYRLSHGQAVAKGLARIAEIALDQGWCGEEVPVRTKALRSGLEITSRSTLVRAL